MHWLLREVDLESRLRQEIMSELWARKERKKATGPVLFDVVN